MSPTLAYLEPPALQALAAALLGADAAVDRTSLYLCAEASDFLRFNQGALRQATHVQQAYVTIAVERGRRRTESTLSLGGEPALRHGIEPGQLSGTAGGRIAPQRRCTGPV